MKFLSIAATRLIWLPPTLFGLLALVFVLSRVMAVDPALLVAGENASLEQVAEVRQRLGFDRPLPTQFVIYLRELAHGDLGTSYFTQQKVIDDLFERLPATLELTIAAVLIAAFVGIPLGVICGLYRNAWPDHTIRLLGVCWMAMASFWLAIQLQLFFSMRLGWLPLGGRSEGFPPDTLTGFLTLDALIQGDGESLASALQHMALPALTLAFPAAATLLRFTRSGVIGALASPSVAYQTVMGLPRRIIVWKYVLRMALSATVTQLGLIFGILLTGAVVVETVFDWPGIGAYAVRSILHSDYNAVMGVTLCAGLLFAMVNLLVDIVQASIDPRGAA